MADRPGPSLWRRPLRGAFDALLLARPACALALADALGRFAAIGLWPGVPAAPEVRAVFGERPDHPAERVARDMVRFAYRERWIRRLVELDGIEALGPFLAWRPGARARLEGAAASGAILFGFHVRPSFAIDAALAARGAPAVIVRARADYRPPPGIELAITEGEAWRPTHALKLAADRLRAGTLVAIAVTGHCGSAAEATVLGRRARFGRGAASLARLTGAPLVPITAHWAPRALAIEIDVGRPLAGALGEEDVHRSMARLLERELCRAPHEAQRPFFARLLALPRAEGHRAAPLEVAREVEPA